MRNLFTAPRWFAALPGLVGAGLLLLLIAPAHAQSGALYDWQFATYLGPSQTRQAGAGEVMLGGLATDPAGNAVVGGSFQPTLTFDNDSRTLQTPYPLASTRTNGFVARYSAAGALTWTVDLVGAGQVAAVATDAVGNVYATGDYTTFVSFNGALPLSGGTSFLVKISPAGVPVWASNVASSPRNYGSANWQLATDAAGNCAVQGDFVDAATIGTLTFYGSGVTVRQPFIARFSAAGTLLSTWVGVQTSDNSLPYTRDSYGLVLTPTGDVYYSGSVWRGTTLNAGNGAATLSVAQSASTRGFIIKISPSGTAEWVLTANVDDVAISAAQYSSASGYVYAVTGSRNFFALGGKSFSYTAPEIGCYIAQIRPDGTIKKFMRGGLTTLPTLGIGPNDDLFLGFLSGSPRWGTVQLTPPASTATQTVGVIRLDSAGTALRGWQATGPAVFRTPKLAVDGQGQAVYAGGVIASGVAFQFGTRPVAAPNAFGIYLARTSGLALAARAAREVPGLALYPNPTSGEVQVQLTRPEAAMLEIRDVAGRFVARVPVAAGQHRVRLPQGLATGTYLVRVAQGEAVSFRRLSIAL